LDRADVISAEQRITALRAIWEGRLLIQYLNQAMPDFGPGREDDVIACTAGTTRLAVRSDGRVFPCVYAFHCNDFIIGDITRKSIRDIWERGEWSLFRGGTRLTEIEECGECAFSRECSAKMCRLRGFYNTGNFYSRPAICPKYMFT